MTRELYTSTDTAMLLVDHQVGIIDNVVQVPPPDEVRANVLALAKAAHVLDMPVVLTSNAEQYQGPTLPALADAVADAVADAYANRVQRRGEVDAMANPLVAQAVAATGRRKLIVAGVGTDVCAVFPALHARREGYDVQVVADACGTSTALVHDIALRHMQDEGVLVTTTAQIIAELAQNFATVVGRELLQIMLSRSAHQPSAPTA